MEPKVPFVWKGKHHGYIGAWFMAFGAFFLYMDYGDPDQILWLWEAFIGVGACMIADDVIEHTWTASTPLRILYNKIILPILRKGG